MVTSLEFTMAMLTSLGPPWPRWPHLVHHGHADLTWSIPWQANKVVRLPFRTTFKTFTVV